MSNPVILNVYDLSQGLASQLSLGFVGKQFDGIWHTGICVFGKEYFFGGGVQVMDAGRTPYGTPVKYENLGTTAKTKNEFDQFVQNQGSDRFRPDRYHLTDNNCNNFTEVCAQFLVGRSIPDYIKHLPTEFLNTPMGNMIRPLLDSMMGQTSAPMQMPDMGNMGGGGMGNAMGNMGGGGMDMNSIQQMMNNPQMMNMVNQVMSNPQMMNQMMQQFGGGMGGFGGGMPNMGGMGGFGGMGGYGNTASAPPQPTAPKTSQFMDDRGTFRFLKGNVSQVITKLKTVVKSVKTYEYTDDDDRVLALIQKFLSNSDDLETLKQMTPSAFDLLKKEVFPVLDIFRLLLISPIIIRQQVQDTNSVLNTLIRTYLPTRNQWKSLSMPTQLMIMRTFANLVGRSTLLTNDPSNEGLQFLFSSEGDRFGLIVDLITQTMTSELDGLRSVAASLAANLALAVNNNDSSDEELQILSSMIEFVNNEKNDEVSHRMVLTIYRFISNNPNAKEIVKTLEPNFSQVEKKANCSAIVQEIKKQLL